MKDPDIEIQEDELGDALAFLRYEIMTRPRFNAMDIEITVGTRMWSEGPWESFWLIQAKETNHVERKARERRE